MKQTLRGIDSHGSRRGQVTVFIILAVMLVILVVMLMFRQERTEERLTAFGKTSQQWDVQSVQTFAQGCVDKVATDAVFYFGMVGGKTGVFKSFLTYDDYYQIPYYFFLGTNTAPSDGQVEKDILAKYVDTRLQRCTDGFKEARKAGVDIQESAPRTTAKINDKSVDFVIQYPLQVSKGAQRTELNEFSFRLPSRLSEILSIAREIVKREEQDDTIIHWDYLTDVTNRGYSITAHAEFYHTIIYRVVDPQSPIYFEPYVFQFANRVKVEG